MRTVIAAIAATLLAGCASAPSSDTVKVYSRKYSQATYASKPAESEFVGTGARSAEKPKPSWYRFGHP